MNTYLFQFFIRYERNEGFNSSDCEIEAETIEEAIEVFNEMYDDCDVFDITIEIISE